MSLFSYISINPFELGYEHPGMIRESTDIFCFVSQRSGRVFSGSNALGRYIHAQLPTEHIEAITNCGWLVELTPQSIKPIDPIRLKDALFAFWNVFEQVVFVSSKVLPSKPIEEPVRSLLLDDHGNPEPTVKELRELQQRMLLNIAGGMFICEKAIRKGRKVCVVVG